MAHTFTDAGRAERVQTATVTPELLTVLQVVPQFGRLPTASDWKYDQSNTEGTTGALLSHDLWVRRYGADPEVVGRTIAIDGKPWAVVVGVAPDGFAFPDPATQAWFISPQEHVSWNRRAAVRQAMFLNAVARLRPGVTLEDAERDLNRLVHLLPEAFPDITAEEIRDLGLRAVLRPLKDEIVGDVRLTLLLVMASGGFLLLVTWANVGNLLLARTHSRRIEIGITRALGASDWDVARRLLSESLLLTMIGGLLGLGLAWLAVGARFGFAPSQLPRLDQVGVNGVVIGLVVTLVVVGGTLMGAICLASTHQGIAGSPISALGSRSATEGREGQTVRRILVAAQMAMALTLLVGSGLMARTFWQLQRVDLGFRPEGRLIFYLPVTHIGLRADYDGFARLHDQVLRRLRAIPGVDAVEAASTSVFPLTVPEHGHDPAAVAPAGAPAVPGGNENWPLAYYGYATPEYFQAMGIPIVAGRSFRSQDTSVEGPGMIISESLAHDLFPGADPIGRSVDFVDFRSFWASLTVVGVVGDTPGTTMRAGGSRAVYLPHLYPRAAAASNEPPYPYMPRWETYVVRTGRDLASLLPELRQAVHEVDPRLPMMNIASLDETVAAATAQERFTMRLLLVSAGAALFLAVVGIYGVLAYSVRRRTAEIGVRIALGASPGRVTRLIVWQGAVMSAAGIAAGLGGALLLTRFIASLLYGTSPTDPVTFTATTLLLFGVALAASYLPARRASRIDPAKALRGA
jgi:putative ABC transport system permease protein